MTTIMCLFIKKVGGKQKIFRINFISKLLFSKIFTQDLTITEMLHDQTVLSHNHISCFFCSFKNC